MNKNFNYGHDCPFVSVVVPTYNRQDKLPLTLDTLLQQDYPLEYFEVIVCDNNSTDETQNILRAYANDYGERIKIIFESRQGVHFARNRAAFSAKGDILYYTDDDMLADSKMLHHLANIFIKYPEVGSATGKVIPNWLSHPPSWIEKYFSNAWLSLLDLGEEEIISQSDIGVFSCHQAMRRDAFFATNGFHPENTAGEWIGDGETGLNQTIKSLGYLFAYTPLSITQHMIPAERLTQQYVNKRLGNQGNCDCYTAFRKDAYTKYGLGKNILSHLYNCVKEVRRSVQLKVRNNDEWHLRCGYIFYHLARVRYDTRLITDKKFVEMVLRNDWLQEDIALDSSKFHL